MTRGDTDPHANQPVRTAGTPLARARAAMVMVHGRGATADSILTLAAALATDGVAYLAPQAASGTWYPLGFMSPIEQNEPGITSGLLAIGRVIATVSAAGVPLERTLLLGFSQGACLSSEYLARNSKRYGGLAALSGGLIGPNGTPRDYGGSLAGTPVFMGCSDVDHHIPAARVRESAEIFRRLDGVVDMRLYPGMGHTVNDEEIEAVRALLATALGAA